MPRQWCSLSPLSNCFLKATVLKPVIHGLVLLPGLAEALVEQTVKQPGFDRYKALLTGIYREVANVEFGSVKRAGSCASLLAECTTLQQTRNAIIHQGSLPPDSAGESGLAQAIATAVFGDIVTSIVAALGLKFVERGEIVPEAYGLILRRDGGGAADIREFFGETVDQRM
ncbi:hypothetical protein BJN34_35890 (plasmid) [Cupriavidus necator]|uniref:Uncharacterized protein n=1 Tax=Cupriavidus necator TaxID=106590 RepID=A0A1U9V2T5_CUPNE|nr:hypothetical protein [Cupriavidus necator]AQV99260.1 hypothetical protein BJN34_35890 [Cupriavidus necator]